MARRLLRCASMRPELTELVLLEIKAGRGVPDDVPGIWSAEDDRALEGCDGGKLRMLEEKHSWRECRHRMRFLEEWREED